MLDTIKIGLLRLDTRDKNYGYIRSISKTTSKISNYFRIPLHVVFDKEGYNTYKEYLKKENPEFKTWVHNITLTIPPKPENCKYYPKAGHEWFLGNLRDLAKEYPEIFPKSLKEEINTAITKYKKAKKLSKNEDNENENEEEDYEIVKMGKAEKIAAYYSLKFYTLLQRSRFDPGRPNKKGEFIIKPFFRNKNDKTAKKVIEEITEKVSDYVWRNPKVSKYSETEGFGLKVKLTVLFLEGFYKEQIFFMKKKLEEASKKLNNKK